MENLTVEQYEQLKEIADLALFSANNAWLLNATVLVFMMHLGFAMLEAGFVAPKNIINILFKNTMVICIGLLTYYLFGFGLMYPGDEYAGGFFGFGGFGANLPEGYNSLTYAKGNYTYWTEFIFQAMFAATAATIVSGAVAERIKLESFLIFTTFLVSICYPITGFWFWGQGWLAKLGFHDLAGSTMIHISGGTAALVMAVLLGPRHGKYNEDGTINQMYVNNLPFVAVGVFLLWFGWFGFNGGSVLSAAPETVSKVFAITALGGASGAIGALISAYARFKQYDLVMTLNGILGGLVAITAGADLLTPAAAIFIGFFFGLLVPYLVHMFDLIRIDDPVGATTVHLIGGLWGTMAVGIFTDVSFLVQLVGAICVFAFTLVFSFLIGYILLATLGLRVTVEKEEAGL